MDEQRYAVARDRAARLAAQHYSATWTPDQREDLVQEVMIKFHRTWDGTDGPDNLDAWLTQVIRTTAINMHETRQRTAERQVPAGNSTQGDPVEEFLTHAASSLMTSDQAIRPQLLDDLLALVPERDAEVIRRKYLWNTSSAEMARELGLTEAAVNQTLTRAKRRLREAVNARPDLLEEIRRDHQRVYRGGRH